MTESKFKVGDLVHHRASLERGVVTAIHYRCATHRAIPFRLCGLSLKPDPTCVWVPSGEVDVEIDFEKAVTVEEKMIELVEDPS